ncbi:MAG: hypothetical protein K8U03_09310 [Planctomycetia bacterium]|nr:hypothetical protein [Planctomycetia bacterium]
MHTGYSSQIRLFDPNAMAVREPMLFRTTQTQLGDPGPPRRGCFIETWLMIVVIAIVSLVVLFAGCAEPQSNALRAKRAAVGILGETAIKRARPSYQFDTLPNYRASAPALPSFAEAYTVPAGDVQWFDPAPTLEPYAPAPTPQTRNAGPCGDGPCPAAAPRLFRRRGRW